MHKILVADQIAQDALDILAHDGNIELITAYGSSEQSLLSLAKDCNAILVRSATKVTRAIIEAGAQLKVIGRAGIGIDNIDVEAATERGVVVMNTPDANATTTAELAIAHILSVSRNLPAADHSVRNGEWKRTSFMGTELSGKMIGIIGFGTIGRIVASRCRGLNMQVGVYDPFVTSEVCKEAGVQKLELDDLLQSSDYITLHCPLIDKTRNLINREKIALMKRGAYLINCARGGIVDEAALYDALKSMHLAGAALDVFEQEPPAGSPLLSLKNIVFTPHLGASTHEAQSAVANEIVGNVISFLKSGHVINAVNLPSLSAEVLQRIKPYADLAYCLGRIIGNMFNGPIKQLDVTLQGRVAEMDASPIANGALIGLLGEYLSIRINQVNARHVAKRQGISLRELKEEEPHDYLGVVSLAAVGGNSTNSERKITLSGTLFDERHPRLVRINNYELEARLEGHLLMTQHEDRPGVIGTLGTLLGNQNVNISRMQLGIAEDSEMAVAVLELDTPVNNQVMQQIAAIPAVKKVLQISL
ncbi:MAG: phosphoglycerate dehydrogenase [Gammaproteobacteria bacterium]|nr:phosphoglycerate dehydrogenase [Gammaproteobacteria bacterium]